MILKNAIIIDENFEETKKDIEIENGVITKISDSLSGDDEIDFSGKKILPGFVDIHIHGANDGDLSDAKRESLDRMSSYLASKGVTSFCPASMTLPFEQLCEQFKAVEEYKGSESGAYIHGINMEGPYIAMSKKGAQCGDYVRSADIEEFRKLNTISKICLVDVAPETENALEFAKEASKTCTVSIAHTAATYEEATAGLCSGFSHATHLYNAMPPIKNREPGAVTAIFDSDTATAELICDGFHNHPAILRTAFKILGEDRAVVVSDSMRAAGGEDGEFVLGGQTVYVRDGKARLSDGTIAASTSNLHEEFLNLLSFGIPFKKALKACTANPARVIGVYDKTGSISIGKSADLLVLNEDLSINTVFIKGNKQ
ncbi:MAG: N-acetylglucosamine-6-phosphate deacetylase [Clostridia bacterium]|nr:N-acetylglucosamine-6-phosphate deacetylase [Clostridia bacterium]